MIDDKKIIEFLRRSYFAVDGLWFVRLEEEHSYEEALRLDEQVWEILPKIQARKARQLLGIESGTLADLALGLWLKFAAEGYEHRVAERSQNLLRININHCPWHAMMVKSGRASKSAEICSRICLRDFAVWAREFSEGITFAFGDKLSEGGDACELIFSCTEVEQPIPDLEKEAAG